MIAKFLIQYIPLRIILRLPYPFDIWLLNAIPEVTEQDLLADIRKNMEDK